MGTAPRAAAAGFGPHWLQRRLRELLPQFPHVRLCVAFSGGADSTALLAALAQLPRRPDALRAVHIDHRLQSDSRRWSSHCRRVARRLHVPLAVRTARIERVRGASPEATARTARYALLAAELAPGEALLTAHHQDDQLETVLLQLLRGAGVAGLAAMPTVTPFGAGVLARPLLGASRATLTGWVREQGLTWVEDPSNAQLRPDRNFLRARVLPLLRARWPAAAATVSRSARHAAEAQRLLDALAESDVGRARSGAALLAPLLRRLSPERRRNALRFWIAAAGAQHPPAARLEEMAGALLEAREDAQPLIAWDGSTVRRESDRLTLSSGPALPPGAAPRLAEVLWQWRRKRTCTLPPPFGTLQLKSDARGPLDLDTLGSRLMLRERRGGERLRLARGGPRRALKQLLQEARVPVTRRAQLPLLFDRGRLIAVADLWLDESVQANDASRRRARLVWHLAR